MGERVFLLSSKFWKSEHRNEVSRCVKQMANESLKKLHPRIPKALLAPHVRVEDFVHPRVVIIDETVLNFYWL